MSEFDGFAKQPVEQRAVQAEATKLTALRSWTREAAIERGRQLGADEVARRGETGEEADNRIRRAMAYAAWEYDGKPADSGRHHQEFASPTRTLLYSLLRPDPDGKRKK